MKRTLLLEEDEEILPRRDNRLSAGEQTLRLVQEMDAILQFTNENGTWHARARNTTEYASADNVVEAMQQALKKRTR